MKKTFLCSVIFGCFFSSSVLAQDDFASPTIFDLINHSCYLGFTLMHLNYKEDNIEAVSTSPGDVSDKGLAYGLAINYRKVFMERLYTDISGEFAAGSIKYDGYGLYSGTPLQQTNFNDFFNGDIKLGGILLSLESLQIIPYGGLGFHIWDRNINGTYEYYNFKAIIGGKVNFALSDDLVVSPYVNFGRTLDAYAKGDASDPAGNNLGKIKFALKSKLLYEFGLEANYRLENDFLIGGMLSYTSFRYGKSDWQTVGNQKFIEPDSKTNEIRLGVGVRLGLL